MKKTLRFFIGLSVILLLTGCNSAKKNEENPTPVATETNKIGVIQGYADLVYIHKNVEELERMSHIIVEATYTGVTEVTPFPESGFPDYETALSKVKITKVHKGDVQVGEEIYVSEPGYVDKHVFSTVSGYKNMVEEGKYVLFLNEFVKEIDGKSTHVLQGAHLGKYDLTITNEAKHIETVKTYNTIEDTEYFGDMADHFNDLKKQIVEKYGN